MMSGQAQANTAMHTRLKLKRALWTFSTGFEESVVFLRICPSASDQVQTIPTSLCVKVNLPPVVAPQKGSSVCFAVSLWIKETKAHTNTISIKESVLLIKRTPMLQNEPQVGDERGRSDVYELRLGNNRRAIIAVVVGVVFPLSQTGPQPRLSPLLPLQPPLAAPAGHSFRSTTSPR